MDSDLQSESDDFKGWNKQKTARKPGRKPYDVKPIDMTDPKFKRKEQNRAAQRAFRERKEKFITELQEQIAQLQREKKERESELLHQNEKLKEEVELLKQENQLLRNAYNSRFDLNSTTLIPPTLNPNRTDVVPQLKGKLPSLFGNQVDLDGPENPAPFTLKPAVKMNGAEVVEEEEEAVVEEEDLKTRNILRCAPENEKPCKSKVLTVLERAKGGGRRVYQVHQELKSYCPEFDLDAFCEGLRKKVNFDANHILTDEDVDIYIDYIKQI